MNYNVNAEENIPLIVKEIESIDLSSIVNIGVDQQFGEDGGILTVQINYINTDCGEVPYECEDEPEDNSAGWYTPEGEELTTEQVLERVKDNPFTHEIAATLESKPFTLSDIDLKTLVGSIEEIVTLEEIGEALVNDETPYIVLDDLLEKYKEQNKVNKPSDEDMEHAFNDPDVNMADYLDMIRLYLDIK